MSVSLTASRDHDRGDRPIAVGARRPHPLSAGGLVVAGSYLVLTVVLVGAGLLITHVLGHSVGRWDDHVNAWFAHHRTSTGNRVTGDFTLLANTFSVVGVAAAVAVIALVRRRARLAVLLGIGLVVELAVFLTTGNLVARPRPSVPHLGSTPSTSSWPSGHVAATVVLYGGIALIVTLATRRLLPRIVTWTLAGLLTAVRRLVPHLTGATTTRPTPSPVSSSVSARSAPRCWPSTWAATRAASEPLVDEAAPDRDRRGSGRPSQEVARRRASRVAPVARRAAGIDDPIWYEVRKSRKAPTAAERAVKEGADRLLLWGGDGTIQRSIDAPGRIRRHRGHHPGRDGQSPRRQPRDPDRPGRGGGHRPRGRPPPLDLGVIKASASRSWAAPALMPS